MRVWGIDEILSRREGVCKGKSGPCPLTSSETRHIGIALRRRGGRAEDSGQAFSFCVIP